MNRYYRNIPTLSKEENTLLSKAKICVIGCGGLGGYSIEMLARLGIGYITIVDSDVFATTNLNRQLFAQEANIGMKKSKAALERIKQINSQVKVSVIDSFITENNAEDIINDHDVIIDGLDNIPARFDVQNACKKLFLPFVHGAVSEWFGQVSTIFPQDNTLQKIYPDSFLEKLDNSTSIPAFTPPLISAVQVSETVKIIIKRGNLLRNKLLVFDLLDNSFTVYQL